MVSIKKVSSRFLFLVKTEKTPGVGIASGRGIKVRAEEVGPGGGLENVE